MSLKILISVLMLTIVWIFFIVIHSTYEECKEDRYSDGYFMMILCVLPLTGIVGVSIFMYFIITN